jgi:hypothetical protein
MNMARLDEDGLKRTFIKSIPRILRAALITAIVGLVLLVFWLAISGIFAKYPEYLALFAALIGAILFFTFSIRVTDGTIFKYGFIVARSFFLVFFIAYATNSGVLSIVDMGFQFTMEFIPILGLMILACLLGAAKGLLEAVEFASESPKD